MGSTSHLRKGAIASQPSGRSARRGLRNPASEALFSRANDWAMRHGYNLTRADARSRVYDHPEGDRLLVDQKDGKFYHSAPQASRTDRDSSGSIGTLGKFLDRRHNPSWFATQTHYTRTGTGSFRDANRRRGAADDANEKFLEREAPKSLKAVTRYKGYAISRTQEGEFVSSLDRDSSFSTKVQAQRHIDQWLKGRGNPAEDRPGYVVLTDEQKAKRAAEKAAIKEMFRKAEEREAKQIAKYGKRAVRSPYDPRKFKKGNPAAAAVEGYEEFHGHPSTETVTVSKKVHFHKHLSGAGELRGLSVKPIGHGLPVRTIGGLKKAILAFNENKNQLFIEGGDQYLSDAELRNFGIRKPHEIETLGKVVALDYHTTKTHLGSEGGTAVYAHKLRTTNENGQHVTVVIARYPDLIYRVVDQQLEFSGGSYEIRAEGIDK